MINGFIVEKKIGKILDIYDGYFDVKRKNDSNDQ
jgi:hypothetical protein